MTTTSKLTSALNKLFQKWNKKGVIDGDSVNELCIFLLSLIVILSAAEQVRHGNKWFLILS